MNTVIIETIVSVLANLAITLIGVAGAWLVTQIGKSQNYIIGSNVPYNLNHHTNEGKG